MATIYQSSYTGEEIDEAIAKVLDGQTEGKLKDIEEDLDKISKVTKNFTSAVRFNEDGTMEVVGDLVVGGEALPKDYSNFDNRYIRIGYESDVPDVTVDLSDYYTKDETYSAEQVDSIVKNINDKFNSVANGGVIVRSLEELENLRTSGKIDIGVICCIRSGFFVSGKVSDLFSTGNQQEFSPSLPDIPYVWNPKFSFPDSCVSKIAGKGKIKIYSEDGRFIGDLNYPFTGQGDWISLSEFGATTIDDEIRFFVGYPMSDGSYPDYIEPNKDVYWNGEEWAEIISEEDVGSGAIDVATDVVKCGGFLCGNIDRETSGTIYTYHTLTPSDSSVKYMEFSGKFSDLFEFYYDDPERGILYQIKISNVEYAEYFEGNYTYLYNADTGNYVGRFYCGVPVGTPIEGVCGYNGNDDDIVSFVITNAGSDVEFNVNPPSALYFAKDGQILCLRTYKYGNLNPDDMIVSPDIGGNGDGSAEEITTANIKHDEDILSEVINNLKERVYQMEESFGDIDVAVNSILTMQDDLVGGDISMALDEVLDVQEDFIGGDES